MLNTSITNENMKNHSFFTQFLFQSEDQNQTCPFENISYPKNS